MRDAAFVLSSPNVRNIIAFFLTVFSFSLLLPGVLQPVLFIEASIDLLGSKTVMFSSHRSIIETVQHLWQTDNHVVSFLVLLFSVIVPVLKGLMILALLAMSNGEKRFVVYSYLGSVSKWSMADVFAMGVLVCFLAANGTATLTARLEVGFYFFLAYCLVSLLSVQVMHVPDPRDHGPPYVRIGGRVGYLDDVDEEDFEGDEHEEELAVGASERFRREDSSEL